MTIHLDHTIVPARHKIASARRLAELLGVPWAESGPGPFAPVFVNDGLTLDFIETDEDFPDLSLLLPRRRRGVRRDPGPDPGGGNPVPQQRSRPGRRRDQHRLRRPHVLLERSRRAPVGTSHGQLRTATTMTRPPRAECPAGRLPARCRCQRPNPMTRIHLLLAAALATASALASAEDKRYDPKALARYDVSYVRCEASFPEMKGHRDDAYMGLWRMKPGPTTATRLAEVRSSSTYKSEQRLAKREAAGATAARRREGARAAVQGPLGRDEEDAQAEGLVRGKRIEAPPGATVGSHWRCHARAPPPFHLAVGQDHRARAGGAAGRRPSPAAHGPRGAAPVGARPQGVRAHGR